MDKYLAMEDDPNFWRTVHDNINGRDIVLSDEDWKLVKSIIRQKFPDNYDPYEPFVEYDYPDADFPVTNRPISKASFTPSKWEERKIKKLIKSLKNGWITLKDPQKQLKEIEDKEMNPPFFLLWENVEESQKKRSYLPPPKQSLPSHAESFNPPSEYLLTPEEKLEWNEKYFPHRDTDFIPQKYNHLRNVPFYSEFIKERWERCVDLYLAPREAFKRPKDWVDKAEDLLPQLPSLKELKPYPSIQSIIYLGHTGKVRSISVDPSGQWLASGSDDCSVRLWEVDTSRCIKKWNFDGIVHSVTWNPQIHKPLLAVSTNTSLYLLHTGTGTIEQNDQLNNLFSVPSESSEITKWQIVDEENETKLKVLHEAVIKQLSWHHKGDYLAAVCPDAPTSRTLLIHQISTKKSQTPFSKQKGKIQCAQFHPSKPLLFIANQNMVKIYNLAELNLEKKLFPNMTWISSIDIHPGGDNIILGSYDCKLSWFDLDFSEKPYKTLRYHKEAIRRVVFHKRYPLFASCSDDLKLHIFHGMVYSDLSKNPMIVPIKQLKGHKLSDDLGILDCTFHPIQSWIFSAGADATIRLYV